VAFVEHRESSAPVAAERSATTSVRKLKIGDRIELLGGRGVDPAWLAGQSCLTGTIRAFLPRRRGKPSAVVVVHQLHEAIRFDGYFAELELSHPGAKWHERNTVDVKLCTVMPRPRSRASRQGVWALVRADYRIVS